MKINFSLFFFSSGHVYLQLPETKISRHPTSRLDHPSEKQSGKVRHLNFLAIFWSNFRPSELENNSSLLKYLLETTKPQLGAKFVVKIPREGTKKVSKWYTYARHPLPPPPSPANYSVILSLCRYFALSPSSFS